MQFIFKVNIQRRLYLELQVESQNASQNLGSSCSWPPHVSLNITDNCQLSQHHLSQHTDTDCCVQDSQLGQSECVIQHSGARDGELDYYDPDSNDAYPSSGGSPEPLPRLRGSPLWVCRDGATSAEQQAQGGQVCGDSYH